MITKQTTFTILLASIIGVGEVSAEEEKLGSTSYDSTVISLGIGGPGGGDDPGLGQILIQNLDTVELGQFSASGEGDLIGSTDFCVYRTGVGPTNTEISYIISPSSQKNFSLTADGTEVTPVKYTIQYHPEIGGSSDTPVNLSKLVNGGRNVTATKNGALSQGEDGYTCAEANNNASIVITANFDDASKALAGNYSDTLTLTVAPN